MRDKPFDARLAAAKACDLLGRAAQGRKVAASVFERLAEHEVRFARLNVLRAGWREQCARPDVDPALKQLVESMLAAIDLAVDRPA